MKAKFTTIIEITDAHIKVLQASLDRASPVIAHCIVQEITQKSDEAISKSLLGMIASAKIKPENLIGVVPRRFAILRHISLPTHKDQEIEKMIALQVSQQIPYPKEDVVLDRIILEKDASGYTKVLVIAVHKEVVERYLKIFRDSKCRLNKLTLSSDGLAHWYFYQESKAGAREKEMKPRVIVNIDSHDTEICFCHNQKLLFARSVHLGIKDLNAENINSFSEQIELTLATYIKENIGKEIGKIILVSNVSAVTLLKEKLETEYKVTTEIIDPLDNITKARTLKVPPILHQYGVSMAVSLGLALTRDDTLINLLPTEIAQTRKTKRVRQEWLKFLLLVSLTLGLGTGVLGINLYKDSSYLEQLKEAIRTIKPKVKDAKEKIRRLEFIKKRLDAGITSIDIIYELYKLTPEDISFTVISMSDDNSLILQGSSEIGTGINILQNNLVESPLFENVTLQYSTKRRVYKGERTDFKITCQITE